MQRSILTNKVYLIILFVFLMSCDRCDENNKASVKESKSAEKTPANDGKNTDESVRDEVPPPPHSAEKEIPEEPPPLEEAEKRLLNELHICYPSYLEQTDLSARRAARILDLKCFLPDDEQNFLTLFQSLNGHLLDFAELNSATPTSAQLREAEKVFGDVAYEYQLIQDYLSLCRTNHILAGSEKGKLLESGSEENQATLFLHVLGDIFGKESGYEGFNAHEALAYRVNALKNIQEQLKDHVFIADKTQARPCQNIDLAILPKGKLPTPDLPQEILAQLILQAKNAQELSRAMKRDVSNFQSVLRKQLNQLKAGEALFLPAGWSGHAVIYQIIKEPQIDKKSQKFGFRIFNSGEGIGAYHASAISGYKTQYFPFVEVVQVPIETISSLIFLRALQEVAIPELYKSSPQDFYERLLFTSGGIPQAISYSADMVKDPQNSGTCTYFPNAWLLSSSVAQLSAPKGEDANVLTSQLEFLINMKTLKDYGNNAKREGLDKIGDVRLNLLKKGLVFFADQAAQGYADDAIDGGALASAADVSDNLSKEILTAEQKIADKLSKNLPQFIASDVRRTTFANLGKPLQPANLITANAAQIAGTGFVIALQDWKASGENSALLMNELEKYYEKLKKAVEDGYYGAAVDGIETIARKLPLNTFSSQTSEDQARKLINLMARLDELFLYAFLKQLEKGERPKQQVSTIEFMVSLKLMTIADALNQKFIKSIHPQIPSMYQARAGEFLFGDTSIFETTDARWQWQIKEISNYYADIREKHSQDFFGFSDLPAGTPQVRTIFFDVTVATVLSSGKQKWRDVDWVVNWIKAQPEYSNWLTQEIKDNTTSKLPIAPAKFRCEVPQYPSDLDGSKWLNPPTCTPNMSYPPAPRVALPDQGADILCRRLATALLTEKKENGDSYKSLPQPFYDLRVASFITDFFLTGNLKTVDTPNLDGGLVVKSVHKTHGVLYGDHSKSCQCSGEEEYQETIRYEEMGKVKRWVEHDGLHIQVDVDALVPRERKEARTRPIEKKDANVEKLISYRYARLSYELLGHTPKGPDDYLDTERIGKELGDVTTKVHDTKFSYVSPYLHLKNANSRFKKYENDAERGAEWHHNELLKIYTSNIKDDDTLDKAGEAPKRKRISPNTLILTTPAKQALDRLSPERMRNLLGLSGFKSQQVIQTLAYFKKYPALLTLPEYQRIFEKLTMETSVILDQFLINQENSRLMIEKLARFCREQFVTSKSYGDYRTMAFILHMNQLFKEQVLFAQTLKTAKIPQGSANLFLDTTQTLFGLITPSLPPAEKSFLYRNIAETYLHSSNLTQEDVKFLLLSVIEHNAIAIAARRLADSYSESLIRNILTTHAAAIEKVLTSHQGADVLDFVAKHVKDDLVGKGSWNMDVQPNQIVYRGQFKNPDQQIEIDIARGALFAGGQLPVLFPLTESEYENVFGNIPHPQKATRLSVDAYEWAQDGKGFRIERLPNGWIYQRQIDNDWYQHMPEREASELVRDSKAFIPGQQYWKKIRNEFESTTIVRMFDPKTWKATYIAVIDDETRVKSVIRVSDSARLIEVAEDSPYRVFANIEDWRFVYIWGESNESDAPRIKEVELPRWNMVFREMGEVLAPRLECGRWQDYVVSQQQFVVGLGVPTTYLVCEAKEKPKGKKRLALTPMAQLAGGGKKKGLQRTFHLELKPDHPSMDFLVYEVNDLNPDTSLSSSNTDGRYYLALRQLWQQKYREASSEIRSISSELGPLTPRQKQILSWIEEGNDNDNDPRSVIVRLLGAYAQVKDQEYYEGQFIKQMDEPAKKLISLYQDYLQRLHRIDRSILRLHEEKRLANRVLSLLASSEENLKKRQPQPQDFDQQLDQIGRSRQLISNRVDAIALEERGEKYSPRPVIVNPNKTELETAKNPDTLEEFISWFQPTVIEEETARGRISPLDPVRIITRGNFKLLYEIVSGDKFNTNNAVALLTEVFGPTPHLHSMNPNELRQEVMALLRLAELIVKNTDVGVEDMKGHRIARFLSQVAEAASKDKPAQSYHQIKLRIAELANKEIELRNEIAKSEKKTDDSWLVRSAKGLVRSWTISSLEREVDKHKTELLKDFTDFSSYERKHTLIGTPISSKEIELKSEKHPEIPTPTQEILTTQIPLVSAAAEDPLKISLFSNAFAEKGISAVVEVLSLSDSQKKTQDMALNELDQILSQGKQSSPDIAKAVDGLQESLSKHAATLKASKKFYRVVDWKKIGKLNEHLKEGKKIENGVSPLPVVDAQLKELLDKIMTVGRKYGHKLQGGAYNQLLHLADIGKSLELNDLIYLLLKQNLIVFYEATGARSADELGSLYSDLVRYLLLSTYAQHAQRLTEAIDAVLKKHKTGEDQTTYEFQQLLEKMMSTGEDFRHYDVAAHVEYLVFEYFMSILMRANQIEALGHLQIVEGTIKNEKALGGVIELIMSAGKTSVLLPLLSVLDRQGEYLNVVVLPEALMASMSKELATRLKSAFGKSIDVISFGRQRYLTEQDLSLLYDRLVRARIENRTIVTNNSTIQSLFLSLIERLYRFPKDASQVRGEIETFAKIFHFLRSYGRLTMDEVDLALDILQAHQFSVGSSISLLRGKYPALQTLPATVFSFYYLIATTPKIYQKIDLLFLSYSRGSGALTTGSYKDLRPLLIQTILDKAVGKNAQFFVGFESLNQPFRDFLIDPNNRELAKTYLLSNEISARNHLFNQIDGLNDNKDKATRLKDIFAILHEELQTVFLLTATKKLGVHYGPLPKPEQKTDETKESFDIRMSNYLASRFIAIPYHSGEPMSNSRFGTPIEALNYTMQMVLERRRFGEMVKEEVDALKAIAQKGVGKSRTARFENRFKALTGDAAGYVISSIEDEQIKKITEHVEDGQQINVQFDLINRYVVPQISVYPAQIVTNAQVYGELFRSVQGMTGTLWSVDTFPKVFKQPVLSDTSEKTFTILWQDYLAHKLQYPKLQALAKGNLLREELLTSLIDQIYGDWNTPGSLMDEAGLFRAFDNEDVAKAIMANRKVRDSAAVQGIIFYDAKDNLKVLEKSGAIRDLDASPVAMTQRIAFWDKKHTTGSDLKLRLDMQAKVVVDHHTTSRGLQQTVWRLRGLGMGQQVVEYLAAEDDFEIMKKKMQEEWKVPSTDNFNVGTLILYSVINQEVRLGELRVRALKQKMKNTVIRQVLDQMFSEGYTPDQMAELYQRTKGLFEKTLDTQALYPTLGIPKRTEKVTTIIAREQKQIMDAGYTKAVDVSRVQTEINKLIAEEQPSLPKSIIASTADSGLEVEIESEMEQEQEQEQEKEQEAEDFKIEGTHQEHGVVKWNLKHDRSFTKAFFRPIAMARFEVNPSLWLYNNDKLQPLFSLPEALLYKKYKNDVFLANAFSNDLLVSLNYAPVHHKNQHTKESHYEYDFFGFYHKELTDVLVILDRTTQEAALVLLDANDVNQWDQFLANDPGGDQREIQVALYSLEQGIFRQGAEPIDEAELNRNEHFLPLLVEAKFFAGIVAYNPNEEPYLLKFLSGPSNEPNAVQQHARKMLNFFKKDVLTYKRDSSQAFRGSELETIFLNILGHID